MALGYFYDIEQYPNAFLIVFIPTNSNNTIKYWIHDDINDLRPLLEFLNKDIVLCGYNNLNYDYPMLHFILTNKEKLLKMNSNMINDLLYKQSKLLIGSEYSQIRKDKVLIRQVDLFKIHHFDNKNKRTSLKWLQFAMRLPNIMESPLDFHSPIDRADRVDVERYCINDVLSTQSFYNHSKELIDLRKLMSKQYNKDFINYSSTKMGGELFLIELEKNIEQKYEIDEIASQISDENSIGKFEPIPIKDIMFNYVKFNTKEFNVLKDWLYDKCITEIKGFFTDIKISSKKDLPLLDIVSKHKDYFNKKSKTIEKLNVFKYDGAFVYGVGGLHYQNSYYKVFEANDDYLIFDWDVESYYPNLAIRNKVFISSIGEVFCTVYEYLFDLRSHYKDLSKKDYTNKLAQVFNEGLKLALNSVYGLSNNEYSKLRDPKYMTTITINGQLLLTMFAEMICERCNATLIQCNTDGITFKLHKNYVDEMYSIVKEWSNITNLKLEKAEYSKMLTRDVNNYISVKTNNTVKLKGDFEIDKDWHKNHSGRIIPIAAVNYLINGISVEDTIRNHTINSQYNINTGKGNIKSYGVYDFFIGVKVKRKDELKLVRIDKGELIEDKLQNVTRYVVSNKGGKLFKVINGDKSTNQFLEAGNYLQTVYNDITDVNLDKIDINYNYYIREANKLINSILSNQTSIL